MKKVSVNDAATYFGISKEAIHNRIRRGSLTSVIENDIKLVVLDTTKVPTKGRKASVKPVKVSDDKYYKLLEEQNAKLQERVSLLENETRSLRDQKELMLIDERKKIEQIYKDKDEQLKNVLKTLSTQFLLTQKNEEVVETLEVEIKEKPISLKKYIKSLDLSPKKMKKLKEKFLKLAKKDYRMTLDGKKCYVNPNEYDYSDLL